VALGQREHAAVAGVVTAGDDDRDLAVADHHATGGELALAQKT
jgi:hypothetical protein